MTKYGEQVTWSMVKLEGTLIQSADASLSYDTKTFKGENGNDVAGVEYNDSAEFTINAVMLEDGKIADVKTAVGEWAAAQAKEQFGLEEGGSTLFSSFKISENIEDAQTVEITCTYYPFMKTSS